MAHALATAHFCMECSAPHLGRIMASLQVAAPPGVCPYRWIFGFQDPMKWELFQPGKLPPSLSSRKNRGVTTLKSQICNNIF